jgi:hypothetical protein
LARSLRFAVCGTRSRPDCFELTLLGSALVALVMVVI